MIYNNTTANNQQELGDQDPRHEPSQQRFSHMPVSLWSFIQRKPGLDTIAFLDKQTGMTTESLGITDIAIEGIHVTTPRSTVHVYQDGCLDKLISDAGTHHIMHNGYVATIEAHASTIIYISGHVGSITVDGGAQIFVYDGAYIDKMLVKKSGFARIHGGSIFYLDVEKGGICETARSENVRINHRSAECEKLLAFTEDAKPSQLRVRITFANEQMALQFCYSFTEEYKKRGFVRFGEIDVAQVHNCTVTDNYTTEKRCLNIVEFYADVVTGYLEQGSHDIRHAIRDGFGARDVRDIDIWWDGVNDMEALNKYFVSARLDDTEAVGAPHQTHNIDDDGGLFHPCCQADD